MKAYVYTHTRLDTNEVFYVGIGTQDNYKRASRSHNRTNYWNNIVKKCGWKVDIVFDNLSWEDACKKEIELIKKYGRIDLGTGTLVNLTDGGDGSLGFKHSEKTKLKMSKTRKGRKQVSALRTFYAFLSSPLQPLFVFQSFVNHSPSVVAQADSDTNMSTKRIWVRK